MAIWYQRGSRREVGGGSRRGREEDRSRRCACPRRSSFSAPEVEGSGARLSSRCGTTPRGARIDGAFILLFPTPNRVVSFPVVRGAWKRCYGTRIAASSGARVLCKGHSESVAGANSL